MKGLGGVGLGSLGNAREFPITREWCRTWDKEPGDGGKSNFLCATAELRQRGEAGQQHLTFAITGVSGYIVTRAQAKRQAVEYWESFFDDNPTELTEMNERLGTRFRSARAAARYIIAMDGEFHGLDVHREEREGRKARVWIGTGWGAMHDDIVEVFPELNWVIDWHLNDMRPGPGGESWEYEPLPAQLVEWMLRGAPLTDEHGEYRKATRVDPRRVLDVVRDAIRRGFGLWGNSVLDAGILSPDDPEVRAAQPELFMRERREGGLYTPIRDDHPGPRANIIREWDTSGILAVVYLEYGIPDPYNDNAVEVWNRIAAVVGRRLGIPGKVGWESYNAAVLYLYRREDD